MKANRNEPCWCGSGKKYKKCHLNREHEKRPKTWELNDEIKRTFNHKKCLAPNPYKKHCSGNIINAHSVSKSGSLKEISDKGHVYFLGSNFDLISLHKYNGLSIPKLIGLNKASTFTGFCKKHDKSIFSPIEDEEFVASQKQCFLLGYRSLVVELFKKEVDVKQSPLRSNMDRGRPVIEQLEIQNFASGHNKATLACLNALQALKLMYDRILLSENFQNSKFYVVTLDCVPDVMTSGGIFPEIDLQGNIIQDIYTLKKERLDFMTVNSFSSRGKGYIVFQWLGEGKSCEELINSVSNLKNASCGIIRFIFEFLENVFIRPKFWDELQQKNKNLLLDQYTYSIYNHGKRNPNCFKNIDDHRIANWKIVSSTMNI